MIRLLMLTTALLVAGCSGSDDTGADQADPEQGGSHVWETQTGQIGRAADVEDVLQQSHERNMQDIDGQAR